MKSIDSLPGIATTGHPHFESRRRRSGLFHRPRAAGRRHQPTVDLLEGRQLLASLTAVNVPIVAVEGTPFTGEVARFNNRAPDLGDSQNLRVPAGNKLAFHVFGEGVQIYTWTGTSWSFVSPEAVLFADRGAHRVVGFHFAGPTWESLSGRKVVGTAIQSSTPNPDAIPWLLLGAASNEGRGIFRRVTFIQRLNTVGGIAPTVPGDFPGQVARVPYTARYFFYRADH